MLFDGLEIQLTVRKGCKRLILRCRDGGLFLSVPPHTSAKAVEAFLTVQRGWMREALARHPKPPPAGDPQRLFDLTAKLLPGW